MRIQPLDFDTEWRRAHPFKWGRNDYVNPFVCHFGSSQHTTTETQNKDPWAPQQPYLTAGFGAASNLLNQPPPQQQNPVAPMNGFQDQALQGIAGMAANGTPITGAANNFGSDLLNGNYLYSNPSMGYFAGLAGNNLGLNNPGASALSRIANSNGSYFAPGNSTLDYFSRNNVGADNPGTSLLQYLASRNQGTSAPGASTLLDLSGRNLGDNNPGTDLLKSLSATNYGSAGTGADVLRSLSRTNLGVDNAGTPILSNLAGTNLGVDNGGTPTLNKYAGGGYFSNGYTDDTAKSIMADVVPKIAAQFNQGNAINNPLAARSAAEGVTSAVAPVEYANYQAQEKLQQDAAQQLATNKLTGGQLQQTAANSVAGNTIAGGQAQGSFANLLQSLGLSGAQLQGQFGQNVAGDILQGEQNQGTFANLAASLGLTGAQLQGAMGQNVAGDILSGANTSAGAAGTLGSNFLTGRQQQLGAASDLSTGAVAGGGLQATAATGLSSPYQDTLAKMVQGQALAPQTQALNYADLSQLFNAGNAYQTQAQNEAAGQAATYNFSQMSPYQQLAAYMQGVTGSYGGTSTDTKPYYTNDTANTLGTVSGIASTAAMLLPFM